MGSTRGIRRRPALWTAVAFGGGILLGECLPLAPWVLWGAAVGLLGAACGLFFWNKKGWPVSVLLLLFCLVAGMGRYQMETRLLPSGHILRQPALWEEGARLSGCVVGEPVQYGEGTRFELALQAVVTDSLAVAVVGRVLVRAAGAGWVAAGDSVVLAACLRRPSGRRNPGAFDYRRFLELQGIAATASLSRADCVLVRRAGEVSLGSGWAGQSATRCGDRSSATCRGRRRACCWPCCWARSTACRPRPVRRFGAPAWPTLWWSVASTWG